MSGQYSVEDLLKLRASPLICKPPNLPAIEEFLSAQEPASKRPTTRSKLDDAPSHSEGFSKRPLLDASQRKSTTDPDRIVLGPPRRSFASSSARANGKSTEGDGDGAKDSYRNDRFGEKRNGRYPREEGDDKFTRRPRDEDGDGRPRRDFDRKPKWAGEEGDDTKPRTHKKFEQPWFRSERGGDSLEEPARDGEREWRRGGGRDRAWDKHPQVEAEPEWMDAPIEEDSAAPPRTQEDFQRWRERMKAGKPGADTTDQTPVSPVFPPPTAIEPKSNLPQFFDEPDDSMDKFYSRLSEQKAAEKQQPATKTHGKSKFAALFGPPPPETQKPFSPEPGPQSQAVPPAREQSASADPIQQMFGGMPLREKPVDAAGAPPITPSTGGDDQAGFARILEMLQGRSNNPMPQGPEAKQHRPPPHSSDGQQQVESPQAPPGLPLLQLLNGGYPPGVRPPEVERHSAASERLQASRSPVEPGHGRQSSQKDEVLLNLLKQANQTPKPTPGAEQYGHRSMSGENLNRAALGRNQMASPTGMPDPAILQRRENGRSDEPRNIRYSDDISPHEYMARRQANEPAMYDEQMLLALRGSGGPKQGQPPPHGPPPGLGRPPGFEQMPPRMPPPGWGAQPPPHQQMQHRQQGLPPPGMPSGRPNIPPGYGMPLPQQGQSQRPPQGAGPPQRKYTGDSGMPMMGPPGFAGNGPPPGILGLLNQQRPPPPPQQQQFQMQGGPPEQQGLGRAFMDMYGDGPGPGGPQGGRSGVRGVGGPMGGYR